MCKVPIVTLARCHIYERSSSHMDANAKFTESMTALARKCMGVKKLEFLILEDPIASDIVLSNQNFFSEELEEALEKVGIKLKVQGVRGGGLPGILEKIREKYPDWSPNFSAASA